MSIYLLSKQVLTKVHELLAREGLVVSYSALHRFARKWCDFGRASSITVRRAESLAGEMAEVDFGQLGLLQELGSSRPRVVHGFILTLATNREPRIGVSPCRIAGTCFVEKKSYAVATTRR